MEKDMAISKLSNECEQCKHKDVCDKKRMMACSLLSISKPNINKITVPITSNIARTITPITINMGEYGSIDTSLEYIKEKLVNDIHNAFKIGCSFMR